MNAKDVLKNNMGMSNMVFTGLLGDLSDADLLVRTSPGANNMAWQLGHLISSERRMIDATCHGTCPALPDGFAEQHSSDKAKSDDDAGYLTKQHYLDLYQKQRAATIAALDKVPEADLDKEAPEFIRQICPNVGQLFALQAMHQMWHVGQLTSLRRHLGKPVMF